MKFNILFSIPVHEHFDVILDQLLNITTLNPNCAVVLHISKVFDYEKSAMSKDTFLNAIKSLGIYDRILINPESIRTAINDIIQAHLSNFNFAKSQIEFEYFSMLSSNEIFIQSGLCNMIKKYNAGCGKTEITNKTHWKWTKQTLQDKDLKLMLAEYNSTKIYSSQIEGSYYKTDIFIDIVNCVNKYYDYTKENILYPREEVYFSSLFWAIQQNKFTSATNIGSNYTYIPWKRISLNVYLCEVKNFIRNKDYIKSVKRVPRNIDDPIRCYLRQKYNYYKLEKAYIHCLPPIQSYIVLSMKNILKELNWYLKRIKRIKLNKSFITQNILRIT